MGFTLYLLCGVLVFKGSDSEFFALGKSLFDGTLERANAMEPIQGRLRTLIATIDDPDTFELLEDTIAIIALIELNRR